MKAWQCIGCGKIEAPQTCVGVCQDRRVEFVYASEYAQALDELELERSRAMALETLVRQLARTTPHQGTWERSYLAMQDQARRLLARSARQRSETSNSADGGGARTAAIVEFPDS